MRLKFSWTHRMRWHCLQTQLSSVLSTSNGSLDGTCTLEQLPRRRHLTNPAPAFLGHHMDRMDCGGCRTETSQFAGLNPYTNKLCR